MEPWLIVVVVLAVGLGLGVAVLAIVLAVRGTRASGRTSDLRPGVGPFRAGPDGVALLNRLELSDLVPRAKDVVVWDVDGHHAVAAHTNGRGWRTHRASGWTTSASVSGSYGLVAITLPGRLPTINVLRDGVLASNVGVESEDFNEARDIRTDDDRVAHAVMTPRVIALLQDLPEDMTVQVIGDSLVSFRSGVPTAAEVQQRAQLLAGVAGAIPAFVYQGLSG